MTGSLDSFDPSAPEHLKVSPIEADKKKESIEIPFKKQLLSSNDLTRLTLLSLLHARIQKFLIKQEGSLAKDLFGTLEHIKKLLETLMKEDASQNYLFAEDLSKHWHLIIRYVEEDSRNKRTPPYLEPLKKWIQIVDTYPEDNDHSLGYYLTRFTGEKWLPFPFMELLYNLHEEALLHKEKSVLSTWIATLSSLLHST